MATPKTPKQVRVYRRTHEITQVAVAAAIGCSDASYRLFESHGLPLPRGLSSADVMRAIDVLAKNGAS